MRCFPLTIVGGARLGAAEYRLYRRKGVCNRPAADSGLLAELATQTWIPPCRSGNFRRAGGAARSAVLAALLAAGDAGEPIPPDTGILGWNGRGCVAEDEAYFRDYLEHGGELGQGRLFVPTLPTAPLAEAAIALGLGGEVAYWRTAPDTGRLFELAADRLRREPRVLLLELGCQEVTALFCAPGSWLHEPCSALAEVEFPE